MNPFQPFYNMKIGVVDLSASRAEVIPLDRGAGKQVSWRGGHEQRHPRRI